MDPAEVLSGAGAKKYGGRFAPLGTRAVYLSDAGASGEVLARKLRLGGQAQISLEKYPRIVFAVIVSLSRLVDLRRSPRLKVAASATILSRAR
ncbi:RES domain-containing protein [Alloacidobacterium dinghuense]|uniref:RES domain-containing protein n=1 Tax=Alloacidobacterium dinghuense TaxID=2763107 RepID=UPI003D802362